MVDILIIEDDLQKFESIKSCIEEVNQHLNNHVTHAECIIEAKKLVEQKQFDILIIDLVIPLRKGEVPHPDNCCAFLEELETSPFLNPPLFVVGLTKFLELNDDSANFFEERLFHLLKYELSSMEWRGKLKKILFHLYKVKEDFLSPTHFRHKYDAAFITALYNPEFEAVQKLATNWRQINHTDDPTIYYEATISENGKTKRILAVYADQMGMVSCATLCTKVILKFRPQYIIMTGITAGVRRANVNYGDILIADLCWDYNAGKIVEFKVEEKGSDQTFTSLKFEPEPRALQIKPSLKNKFIELSNNKDLLYKIRSGFLGKKITNDLSAFVGPIASGSQVVASSSKMNAIKDQNRKLIGIEMEAYGLKYACTQIFDSKVVPIIIKSICDFGDETKDDSFQEYAAYTSAQFAKHFLFHYL
ncbi:MULTISPECIES: 5'-methylthioadenosine/S-adenosylhomocysteine nucleosidase family protein [Niastella]|uniref:Nucleoside phosphorylase domain-containing protein n=1 Tax=Niastella soli TaxID=2821487 RepID=A0ABS3Z5E3_9BACT|nr:hypothetical protein [Niastella soli]MBO9204626.1 hypothetical protein [Niastella soli]